jgi:eukaryotic-like serine/threonine-protein kinase
MRDAAALLPIAESIADGAAVDWNDVESRASAEDRATVRQLRVLAELATLHRTMPVDPNARLDRAAIRRTAASPAIGTWGHLDLLARIGGGRFGDVYRAWDRDLEREVALKLLQPDIAADQSPSPVVTDGRLPARVRHANVVTIYGVAVHEKRVGVWMELVNGETLEQLLTRQGPFSAREATLVGIDLCRAVAAIHAVSLIHRDIKAQNVMREQGGRIVLMDFGTGRDLEPNGPETATDLAGTPLYLAPEILTGGPAGPRTDIYSLGVLLYHLATGSFPVRAESVAALNAAHARHQRTRLRDSRPDLPTAFVRVVDRAIAADPNERYTSAGALEEDLVKSLDDTPQPVVPPVGSGAPQPPWYRTWPSFALAATLVLAVLVSAWLLRGRIGPAAVEARAIRSIAVLPLVNLSGDPSQEYFADGMTEALIDNLAKVRALRVISRTSAMQFKNTRQSLAEIAMVLNVDGVLEGSVTRVGDRVRISADLVHVATDRHVWVENYDRDVRDILALQSEVAGTIARAIQVQLTPVELAGFASIPQVSPSAQEAYLQGRYYWNKRTDEGYQKALDYFRQAAAIDSSFARAYAGQADVYNLLPARIAPATAYPLAKDASRRALALDPTLAEAHTSLAFAAFIFDRDWTTAEAGFKRALQFNPGYATAHHWFGEYLVAMSRFDEAITELQTAKSLDPLSSAISGSLADAFYMARRPDEAIPAYDAALEVDRDNPSLYLYMALAHASNGQLAEANAVIERGLARLGPRVALRLVGAAIAAQRGDRATAMRVANEMTARGPEIDALGDLIAYVYVCLGDTDRAFAWLSRAEQARAPGLITANVEPIFDRLRNDARFDDLLRRLRLAP